MRKKTNPAVRETGAPYGGLFLVALATLTYEILLTRIFSVTMWYHFSFVAISVAMFGMTLGAVLVYLRPEWFSDRALPRRLAAWALAFAGGVVLSFVAQLYLVPDYQLTVTGIFQVAVFYLVIAAPFVVSGVCITLCLTRFGDRVGRLYAADLAGAATGCVLLIVLLEIVDGPSAVFVVAALAAAGAALFVRRGGNRKLRAVAITVGLVLVMAAVFNAILARQGHAPLALRTVKGQREAAPLYERWNSHSRVTVSGDPDAVRFPFGWGMSPVYQARRGIRYLYLQIDAGATTVLPRYQGDPRDLEYLQYDIVNLAHWLRQDARVAAIGSGGGRDIHAAIAFDQAGVTGVEVNAAIIDAVTGPFAEWTGRLADDPRVTFVHDEARSWIARSGQTFDIIQISFIDTWAATAAGAYVLTENALYTVEAWTTFLGHLAPDGILTVSRWYGTGVPGEAYRSVALAAAALKRLGIEDPRRHLALVRNMDRAGRPDLPYGVGTLLVSPQPFSAGDLAKLAEVSGRLEFDVVLTPDHAADPRFALLATGGHAQAVSDTLRLAVTAPTDDSPFFFQQLRLGDVLRGRIRGEGLHLADHTLKAVRVLGSLLVAVVLVTVLFLIVPLFSRGGRGDLRGAGPLLVFFACIGLGFMLVEISQLQRLTVLLGHPTYGLSVVLFSLLLSAGAGSFATGSGDVGRGVPRWFVGLLAVLLVFGLVTPVIGRWGMVQSTPVRIAAAVLVLLPLGFFMGMAFPSGMRLASRLRPGLMPWLFGVNGATSVCASVLAVAIALAGGISVTFWTGAVCYVVALVAYLTAARRAEPEA